MDIVSSRPVSMATVKKILDKRSKDEELGYEQTQSLEYATKFDKFDEKQAIKLVEEIAKNGRVNEETAIKIVDVMPKHLDTLKAILLKDKTELSEEELSHVFSIIQKAL